MAKQDTLLQDLAAAWKSQADLERQVQEGRAGIRKLTEQAIAQLYPSTLEDPNFLPLTDTTALVVHRVEMRPPLVPGQAPYWAALGHKVRFRVGHRESVGPFCLGQAQYEALSDEVKALTQKQMLDASRAQKLTGMNAPLKLTERQCEMFSLLVNNNERLSFSAAPVEGGQRLPSAIWDSVSATQSIWTAMVKRGVLELASGDLSGASNTWRVNPGPRFADAVSLVAKYLHGQRPGVPATLAFYEKFGLKPPSTSPRPR